MAINKILTLQRAFRGILTLSAGFFLLLMPGITIRTALMVIGAMLFINGLISLIITNKSIRIRGFFSFQGFFNVITGLAFMFVPEAMLKVFVAFFGIILLMIGSVQLISALTSFAWRLWSLIYLIFALAMLSGGILLLYNPFKSLEAIVSFIGMLLIFYGISQVMSFKVKKQTEYYKGSPVEDIPHEEAE